MEKAQCGRSGPAVRKEKKKKQAKDELDRLKQAERKKRRLEKALAASAAIRSELEKKKQKKKEEQQRLDEEGAAIAEAVALHVLLGEDSDDSCRIMLKNGGQFGAWNRSGGIDLLMGYQSFEAYEGEGCSALGMRWSPRFQGEKKELAESSVGHMAAEALSSLRIAEGSQREVLPRKGPSATAVVNGMLGGGLVGHGVDFYRGF